MGMRREKGAWVCLLPRLCPESGCVRGAGAHSAWKQGWGALVCVCVCAWWGGSEVCHSACDTRGSEGGRVRPPRWPGVGTVASQKRWPGPEGASSGVTFASAQPPPLRLSPLPPGPASPALQEESRWSCSDVPGPSAAVSGSAVGRACGAKRCAPGQTRGHRLGHVSG